MKNMGGSFMSTVLIIGSGGVASVGAQKCAQNHQVFKTIIIASRTKSKCEAIVERLKKYPVKAYAEQVDAEIKDNVVALIKKYKPVLVMNLALPYQNIPIMQACIETKTHYLDTAAAEVREKAGFEYSTQWVYHERFKKAGVMALLGSGFDPGVTSVFCMYGKKHYFDTVDYIDILDANGGDHGYPFATNFNPEINIREITMPGRYYDQGKWVEIPALTVKETYLLDEIGPKDMYLMYHEELESIVKFIPEVKRARFYMSFSEKYLTHLRVLVNIGMTSVKPIIYEGKPIVPLQFLKAILPDPSSLGPRTKGKTNIGVTLQGHKQGKPVAYRVFNICDHEKAFAEVGSQAISYTTGVPAMIGAALILTKQWKGEGVFNVEQFNPDPYMAMLNEWGLPWKENFKPVLVK
jgi:saccharopine dehydrogenase (NAD+, L-lysine-forming)